MSTSLRFILVATRICAALALLGHSAPLAAQDITLQSRDLGIEVSGSLLSFDGEYYRLDSRFGPLTIRADGVSCAGTNCPNLETLVIEARLTGTSQLTRTLLPELLDSFARDRGMRLTRRILDPRQSEYVLSRTADDSEAARFLVTSGTTEDGFLALLNGDADIALAAREPLAVEDLAAQASEPGGQPPLYRRGRIVALDAMVAVTAPDVALRAISPEDLASVFTGRIQSWAELGQQDQPIRLHLPEVESGLSQMFVRDVIAPSGRALAPEVIRHDDLGDLAAAVAADPTAIGITALAASGITRPLALSGSCGYALLPDDTGLKTEDYPFTAPLYLYTPPRRLPRLVREFVAYFESAASERLVRQAGFVSQTITASPLEDQGRRLAQAILAAGPETNLLGLQDLAQAMAQSARLSSTIRFADGSSEFDTQSRASISRLARALERGEFDGRRLVFVGFSDGAGAASANLRLSVNRAEAVAQAVRDAAFSADLSQVEFSTQGFGEALPMACDDTAWGRAVNRRVEVWLQ
ncbi:MAG: phosphate ABC transporter substrate-binding/OmpA family protein [Pseudomonadota bacterium]